MSFKWLRFVLVFALLAVGLGGTLTAQETDGGERPVITADNVGELTELYRFGRGIINSVAASPDGTIMAVGTPMGVWLYDRQAPDLITDPPLLPAQSGRVDAYMPVAFNADGTLLAMGDRNHVIIWDVTTMEIVRMLYSPESVRSVAFLADDAEAMLVGTGRGEIITLDFATWTVPDENSQPEEEPELNPVEVISRELLFLEINADRTLLAAAGRNTALGIVNLDTLEVVYTTEQERVKDFAFSPDGTTLVMIDDSNDVFLFDTTTWELIWQVTPNEDTATNAVTFQPDGNRVLLATVRQGIFYLDAVTGEAQPNPIVLQPDERFPQGTITDMVFSTSDEQLFVAETRRGSATDITLVDLGTRTIAASSSAHMMNVRSAIFNPVAPQLTFSDDQNIYTWEVGVPATTDELVRIDGLLRNENSGENLLGYTTDGSTLIRLGLTTVNAYDTTTGEIRFTVALESMHDVEVFAEGTLIVVVGGRGVNFGAVLDATTGDILYEFGDDTFGGEPFTVTVSADNALIAVATVDGSVRVFGIAQ